MNHVSVFQLYLLRAMYLLVVIGLGLSVLPDVFSSAKPFAMWSDAETVQTSMLGAFWLLSMLGLRYPLQMLPILLWELVWKTLWLLTVPLPRYLNGTFDESLMPNVIAIGMVVLVYLVLPWGYLYQQYVKQPGTAWSGTKAAQQ